MTTIAVTGATGQLGRQILSDLKTRAPGAALVALARNPAAVSGAAAREFDYSAADPLVLIGVDVLVLVSSNSLDDRAGHHRKAIDAAKAAGVGRIVYTSILKGDTSPMKFAADHVQTEAHLRASGLTFTILSNGWYTENYTGSLGGALQAGAMIGSAGDGRISSAARADYAEAAAVVAAGEGHAGKVYELAGDEAHSMAGMAAEVSRLTGRSIPYNSLPEAVYAGILESFGLPAGLSALLADADAQGAQGALFDDSRTLSRLIGRPTTPMAATVAAAVAAL